MKFFVTIAANMPRGPGYYEILAPDEEKARETAHALCPAGRWSFMYTDLKEIHPLDHNYLGTFRYEEMNT